MSLRDEINSFRNPPIPANAYSDEEVFTQLVRLLYERSIRNVVKQFFESNPSASHFSQEIVFWNHSVSIVPCDDSEFNRYINGSSVYAKREDSIVFKEPFYKFERKKALGKNKIIYITPLGERVYKALQELAARDGIVFDGLKACYYCQFHSWGTTKTETIYPPLGVWFAGKDPDHWKHRSGGNVSIVVSFSM